MDANAAVAISALSKDIDMLQQESDRRYREAGWRLRQRREPAIAAASVTEGEGMVGRQAGLEESIPRISKRQADHEGHRLQHDEVGESFLYSSDSDDAHQRSPEAGLEKSRLPLPAYHTAQAERDSKEEDDGNESEDSLDTMDRTLLQSEREGVREWEQEKMAMMAGNLVGMKRSIVRESGKQVHAGQHEKIDRWGWEAAVQVNEGKADEQPKGQDAPSVESDLKMGESVRAEGDPRGSLADSLLQNALELAGDFRSSLKPFGASDTAQDFSGWIQTQGAAPPAPPLQPSMIGEVEEVKESIMFIADERDALKAACQHHLAAISQLEAARVTDHHNFDQMKQEHAKVQEKLAEQQRKCEHLQEERSIAQRQLADLQKEHETLLHEMEEEKKKKSLLRTHVSTTEEELVALKLEVDSTKARKLEYKRRLMAVEETAMNEVAALLQRIEELHVAAELAKTECDAATQRVAEEIDPLTQQVAWQTQENDVLRQQVRDLEEQVKVQQETHEAAQFQMEERMQGVLRMVEQAEGKNELLLTQVQEMQLKLHDSNEHLSAVQRRHQEKLRTVAVKLVLRWQLMALAPAMSHWVDQCQRQKKMRRSAEAVVRRWKNVALSGAWQAWHGKYSTAKKIASTALRTIRRLWNIECAKAFARWQEHAQQQADMRKQRKTAVAMEHVQGQMIALQQSFRGAMQLLTSEATTALDKVEALTLQVQQMQHQLLVKDNEIVSACARLKHHRARSGHWSMRVHALHRAAMTLRSGLGEMKEKVREDRHTLAQACASALSAVGQCAQHQSAREARACMEAEQHRRRAQDAEAQSQQVVQDIDKHRSEARDLTHEHEMLQQAHRDLQHQLLAERNHNASLQEHLHQVRGTSQQQGDEMQSLRLEFAQQARALEAAQNRVMCLQHELAGLTARLEVAQEDVTAGRVTLRSVEAEAATLREQAAAAHKEQETLRHACAQRDKWLAVRVPLRTRARFLTRSFDCVQLARMLCADWAPTLPLLE